eukprot:TRINITY_DN5569_c0_g1_i1.p1 TRINITY_DN5569_c0_g1~~TRINITY_DN5569_c0_g1_i1.p1  ORF type:complete len:499 (+),score=179.72 TRINITY_DN5569_c0_g1_i1:138-1634(+)
MASEVPFSPTPAIDAVPLKAFLRDAVSGKALRTLRVRVAAEDWSGVAEYLRDAVGKAPYTAAWLDDEGDVIVVKSQPDWEEAVRAWAAAVRGMVPPQSLVHPLSLLVDVDAAKRARKRAERAVKEAKNMKKGQKKIKDGAGNGVDAKGNNAEVLLLPRDAREKRPVYVHFYNGTAQRVELQWSKSGGKKRKAANAEGGAPPRKVFAKLLPCETFCVRTYAKQRWCFAGDEGFRSEFVVPMTAESTWVPKEEKAAVKAEAKRRPITVLIKESKKDLETEKEKEKARPVPLDAASLGSLPDIHRSPSKYHADGTPILFTMPESPGRKKVADPDIELLADEDDVEAAAPCVSVATSDAAVLQVLQLLFGADVAQRLHDIALPPWAALREAGNDMRFDVDYAALRAFLLHKVDTNLALRRLPIAADWLAHTRRICPADTEVLYRSARLEALAGRPDVAMTYVMDAALHGFADAERVTSDPDLQSLKTADGFYYLLSCLEGQA